jgi:hypothetical protein
VRFSDDAKRSRRQPQCRASHAGIARFWRGITPGPRDPRDKRIAELERQVEKVTKCAERADHGIDVLLAATSRV